MQEFFMDYGLWLLIALLVVIALVFLLSTRRSPNGSAPDEERPAPEARAVEALAPEPSHAMPVSPAVTAPPETPPAAPEPPAPQPAAPEPTDTPDDLLKLKGIGPKLNLRLIELGVTRYAQIAAWSEADVAAIDAKLGAFKGRPVRDQWVDQARYLAAGDIAGYEAVYGKL